MTRRPPYREGRVHVLSSRCATCVFRPGNLMRLNPGRLADLVQQNRSRDTALTCHATLGQAEAVCRGYFDAYGDQITPLRLAVVMDVITEQDPPPKEAP